MNTLTRLALAGIGLLAAAMLTATVGVAVFAGDTRNLARNAVTGAWTHYAPTEYVSWFAAASTQCPGVTPELLAAQASIESRFNPDAVSPAGAQGIAQFMPGTWQAWGRDADGDGLASPFDPPDAIIAQAAFLCHLLGLAQSSGIPADPVLLALAGYNAGWGAVTAHAGVPPYPETQNYVARITALAASWAQQPPTTGGFRDGLGSLAVPRANPRPPAEAIAWATQAVTGPLVWHRLCLRFTARAYGWTHSGSSRAIDHWTSMPAQHKHTGDRTPPPGALLFFDTASPEDHVALYLGGGLAASTDIARRGGVDIVPADLIEHRWAASYLGWTAPYYPNGA